MQKVKRVRMLSMTYPTLKDYRRDLKPQMFHVRELCNDDPNYSQSTTTKFKKTKGEEYNWSVGASVKLGQTIEVSAGMPFVTAKVTTHWEVGATTTYSQTKKTTHEEE